MDRLPTLPPLVGPKPEPLQGVNTASDSPQAPGVASIVHTLFQRETGTRPNPRHARRIPDRPANADNYRTKVRMNHTQK